MGKIIGGIIGGLIVIGLIIYFYIWKPGKEHRYSFPTQDTATVSRVQDSIRVARSIEATTRAVPPQTQVQAPSPVPISVPAATPVSTTCEASAEHPFCSADESIATVDSTGVITGQMNGITRVCTTTNIGPQIRRRGGENREALFWIDPHFDFENPKCLFVIVTEKPV